MKGIVDSTLREGAQAVGVAFSLEQKKSIIRRLVGIGVEEIELGVVSPYDDELIIVRQYCRSLNSPGRAALWCRCLEKDVSLAIRHEPDVLSLSIPGSDLHIQKKLGRSRDWVLDRITRSIRQARRSNIGYISLGIEDATRADPEFLQAMVKTASAAGADRVRLADTVGISTPDEITALIRQIKQSTTVEIGVHCHNDFGMATANSIAALENGADWTDATVYGIGERSGNARLEEITAFLVIRQQRGYDLSALREITKIVTSYCGRGLDPHHPVVGDNIFQCETGLHLQGLKRDPATYEPFPPEQVGAQRQIYYGHKIGNKEVKEIITLLGMTMPLAKLEKLIKATKTIVRQRSFPLHEDEFKNLVASMLAGI